MSLSVHTYDSKQTVGEVSYEVMLANLTADIAALAAVVNTGGGVGSTFGNYVAALTAIVPSATLNVYGAAETITPENSARYLEPLSIDIVFSGTGSETVTVKVHAVFSDASTQDATFTATSDGTTALTNAQLRSIFKDGLAIASLAFSVKSSISSSTESVSINSHGSNRNG